MNALLKSRLLKSAAAIAAIGGAATTYHAPNVTHQPAPPVRTYSHAVELARELGQYYESSGKHIGIPYIDRFGKGQPLTVCAGITGTDVVAGRWYTPEDCKRLEISHYEAAEKKARAALLHWNSYNVWVQASFIDIAYNVPAALSPGTGLIKKANKGDLNGACKEMRRWVMGTVKGVKKTLPGLVDRRATTHELCSEWGREGHFSFDVLAAFGRRDVQK